MAGHDGTDRSVYPRVPRDGRLAAFGTSEATTLAVRRIVLDLRKLGFKGRPPNLQRELPDGTLQLANLQRTHAGITGGFPAFTINLNVVHGALLRAWRASGYWMATRPVRSGGNVGVYVRLAVLVSGYDGWWSPSDSVEAEAAANEAIHLMHDYGLEWLGRLSDPDYALTDELLPRLQPRVFDPPSPVPPGLVQFVGHTIEPAVFEVEVPAALLVERPDDPRRSEVVEAIRRCKDRLPKADHTLLNWLLDHLIDRT